MGELEIKHMFLLAEFMFLLELLKIMKIRFCKKEECLFLMHLATATSYVCNGWEMWLLQCQNPEELQFSIWKYLKGNHTPSAINLVIFMLGVSKENVYKTCIVSSLQNIFQ